jgi:signal transduction histidine kinase
MQERELRTWLLSGDVTNGSETNGSLGAALEALAAAVETDHGVPVEVVRVRDCPVEGLQPLLAATREAIVNAARHSGSPSVSVYLEVEPERATIFVRDRGRGFDPQAVAADRSGIAGSIVGRLTRAGGTASVRSQPGEGTEVELVLPRARVGEQQS